MTSGRIADDARPTVLNRLLKRADDRRTPQLADAAVRRVEPDDDGNAERPDADLFVADHVMAQVVAQIEKSALLRDGIRSGDKRVERGVGRAIQSPKPYSHILLVELEEDLFGCPTVSDQVV